MRWQVEEALKRSLPYGAWIWSDPDGADVETIFSREYKPIATRVNGSPVETPRSPGGIRYPSMYVYGIPPWRSRETRERCEALLRDWGIDPEAAFKTATAEVREEHRARRAEFLRDTKHLRRRRR